MSALVLLASGFEEIEAITVIDLLRRAEIETLVAGLSTNPIFASRQTRHLADIHLADVPASRDFEVVVLPGGVEGAKNLASHPLVGQWLFRQRERGQWVAAICAAPTALLAHGWLESGTQIVAHPSVQSQFASNPIPPRKRVVIEGRLITSLAAGSAMEFGFEIVRQLRGQDAMDKVNQGVCALFTHR